MKSHKYIKVGVYNRRCVWCLFVSFAGDEERNQGDHIGGGLKQVSQG